ncbi:hypothetical protein ACPA1T_03890 [Bacillus amyloliquefaciens]|uniref:hypothetical protein n=1 Tax=Bacillus amyloliquefaciens TaxID=1390 RepID=UPI003C72CBA8
MLMAEKQPRRNKDYVKSMNGLPVITRYQLTQSEETLEETQYVLLLLKCEPIRYISGCCQAQFMMFTQDKDDPAKKSRK